MRTGSTLLKALLAQGKNVSHLPEIDLLQYNKHSPGEINKKLKALSPEHYLVIKRPAPYNWQNYPPLVVEKSKKIILFRNPHDTIRSLHRMISAVPDSPHRSHEFLLDYWVNVNEKLLSVFPKDRPDVAYVRYEDLVENPIKVTEGIFRFLGLSSQKGVSTYERPNDFSWTWGSDDQGDKINSLRVQPPGQQEVDPILKELIVADPRVLEIVSRLGYRLELL
jgi:hypothetical protein